MKNIATFLSIIGMIIITSCKAQKQIQLQDTDKALISLSKGKCLGKCPVYDLWIFSDGKVLYNGLSHVDKKGVLEGVITQDTLKSLIDLIKTLNPNDVGTISGRDLPMTVLRYDQKKVVYQASRIQGNLLKINKLLDDIKKTI